MDKKMLLFYNSQIFSFKWVRVETFCITNKRSCPIKRKSLELPFYKRFLKIEFGIYIRSLVPNSAGTGSASSASAFVKTEQQFCSQHL